MATLPPNAVRIKAKHICAGDTLCFSPATYNFRVARAEEHDAPYPQIRVYSADEALTLVYGLNDDVIVNRN